MDQAFKKVSRTTVFKDLIRQKSLAMQHARSVWEVKPVAGCYHRERRPSPILLDIEIKVRRKRSGSRKEIRKKDLRATIVFVTTPLNSCPLPFSTKWLPWIFIDRTGWGRVQRENQLSHRLYLEQLGPRYRYYIWEYASSFYHLHTQEERLEFYAIIADIEKQIPLVSGAAPLWWRDPQILRRLIKKPRKLLKMETVAFGPSIGLLEALKNRGEKNCC